MSARDMERVATLTAYANGVGYFCSRVLGSIPGPIVLAAIIDAGVRLLQKGYRSPLQDFGVYQIGEV